MRESKMCRLPEDMVHQHLSEDTKVGVYMPEMRMECTKGKKATTKKKKILMFTGRLLYSTGLTFFVGKCAIYAAFVERGYKAYGGEYCLIAMTFAGSMWATKQLAMIGGIYERDKRTGRKFVKENSSRRVI